jgi:hypothetical protein
LAIDYRCDDRKKVGELRGDIGAILEDSDFLRILDLLLARFGATLSK